MGSLSNLYISQSYQSLIHLGNDGPITTASVELQDGLGNGLGLFVNSNGDISSSGNFYAANLTGSDISALNAFTQSQISFNNSATASIVELQNFSSSLDANFVTEAELAAATASLITQINTKLNTSSFNAYTQSNDQRVSSLEVNSGSVNTSITNINSATASLFTSVDALNTFTASQSTASLVNSINELNTFSASAKTSITELNTNSASVNTSISNLNSFTQSQEGVNILLAGEIDSLQNKTGSYATTGSNNFIGNQTITGNITAFSASFTYLQTIFESSSIIYSSGSNQFGDELTDVQTLSGSVKVEGSLTVNGIPVLTSSVDISGLVTTASFNAYTQSNDSKVNSLIAATASYADSASVAAVDAAQQSQIDSLIAATSSYADSASFAASQLVQDGRLNNLESTSASVNISITNLNVSSASQQVSIDALNTFTASQSTASLVNSINELNQFSSSTLIRLTNIESTTSSLNTSVSNINSATASLFTSASLGLTTASFTSQTLTFTKGDGTTFDIVIPDVSGSLIPSGTVSGSSQIILQDTTGNLSGSRIDGAVALAINSTYADNTIVFGKNLHSTTIAKGTPLYFTGSGTAGNIVGILPADAGNPLRMPAGGIAGESIIVDEEGIVILDGFINEVDTTAFAPGDEVFVGVGGGYTNVIPTGSNNLIQFLGYVEKSAVNGSGVIQMTGEARALPNIQQGYVWVGNVNDQPIAVPTSSFIDTFDSSSLVTTASFNAYTSSTNQRVDSLESNSASVNVSISNLNSTTQSLNTSVSNLNSATSSLFTSASLALVTASVSGTTLTFTKGDASTFNVTLPTGSGGGTIDTGSFATTGSNSFNGDQNITGSIRYSQQLLVGTTNLGPTIQALDSGTPAGMTGLQVNAGESGSFSMRTLYGGGIGQAVLEAYNTFPSFNSGGKIFAKSAGGVNIEGYSGEIAITGSNTKIQGLTYPNTDGTNGQVLTTNGSGILSFTSVSGSGGTIDTGSFAITGSNLFRGNQTIAGNVTLSGSNDNRVYIERPSGTDVLRLGVSDNGNTWDFKITGSADQQLWLIDNQGGTYGNAFFGFIQAEGRTTINAPFTASQGAQINGGDLRVAGNLTASLQEGYVWVGDSTGTSTTVATSSFGGGGGAAFPFSGSAEITGSLSVSETIETQIYLTPQTLTGPLSVPTGFNGMLTGPVSNSGIITIESGSTLVII